MKDCDAFRRLISPFLDGELVGEDRAAFEEHVASCASCRASLSDERAVVVAVKAALPLYEAPDRLRGAVTGILSARPARRPRWRAPLAAGLAAAAVVGTVWLARSHAPVSVEAEPASEFASLAARTHLRYTQSQLPLEVSSQSADEVSSWFAGRVPFRLALPDYPVGPGESKPYQLAGGRLISFKNDEAAFVAYRMEDRPISLLITSASLVRPTGRRRGRVREPALPHRIGGRAQGHHLDRQRAHLRPGLGPGRRGRAVMPGVPWLAGRKAKGRATGASADQRLKPQRARRAWNRGSAR